ncbi:LAG1-DNAbind-domain-containing protein [Trametopsis cervina]|nr:LAG1-DNAbind-domain-containing protein [Trametopsis cervina]
MSHSLDRSDLDVGDHGSYDLFGSSSNGSLASQRYRTNASSSSSLGPSYSLGVDTMYPPSQFPDTLPSFHSGSHPYDLIGSLPSSYSSGKPSPLTPSDVSGLPHPSGFPFSNGQSKDFSSPNYHDPILDRRMPGVNGSFSPDFNDDYGNMGVSSGLGLNGFHPPNHLQQFQDRLGRVPHESRFPGSTVPPLSTPSHLSQNHGSDMIRGVAPQATHSFRPENGLPPFDDMPQFMGSNSQVDYPLRMPSVDENMARLRLQGAGDLQTFIRPYLDQYTRTPNRLAFGERTVIVMSSKVAQKSYGTEKRFLCPPPTAIMIGNSWWSDVLRRGEEPKVCPPRVVISISGEPAPQEGSIEWTSATGKSFDVSDPPTGTTYIGRCVGKQLFISDVDEKKKKVEALVKIMAPSSDDEPERVIGTFPSRPIKVISKPSKKRQSAKNLELCINHGSTISLFHRLRSQTVSTKYLCVSGSGSSFKGSDGAPLLGLDQRSRSQTPSFIARTASWDPFIMYIVDVKKPSGGLDTPPPPPPQPEFPSPPPNAIPFTNNGSQIPIYYNQTVVLQCLTSGVVSPVLIIRKVDHATTVVGGGPQEGAKGVIDQYCTPGEVCGDPVSQLHKIAFEVYDPNKGAAEPGTPGLSGAFLSCMGEKVNTYRPVEGRQWNSSIIGTAEAESPIATPTSPTVSTPISAAGSADYFGGSSASSVPTSPDPSDFPSNDGGKVKKGKRGSSSGGGLTKPASQKGRRRPTSAGSATGSAGSRRSSNSDSSASSGALWQVDIGETSVWTIVGTDQVRYNFYVPPFLFDNQNAPQTGSFPIPSKPVTPFPGVVKYLPPDRASEAPKSNCPSSRAVIAKPNPHASKMLTVYGENFSKADPVTVFFGSDPSPYVEVRCTEVVGCLPPESNNMKRRPIILVRHDGVVFPSNTMYP